jgi:diketogulonate reductase-like aldo/keto reductase/Kef-type K+ transport system membrane component KefB
MNLLFYVGLIFLLGSLVALIAPKLKLPKVVGYLLLGVIIGPNFLAIIPHHFVQEAQILTDLALSVIAIIIGAKLKLSTLKQLKSQVLTVTLFNGIGTFIAVTLGFIAIAPWLPYNFDQVVVLALIFGGLASATEPAATLAVINEQKAKGSFVFFLLSVVALDDAVALVLYYLGFNLSTLFMGLNESITTAFWHVGVNITLSIALGIVGGLLGTYFEKLLHQHKQMETISTLGLLFIVYTVSSYFELEPLMSALSMGVVLTNLSPDFDFIEKEIDNHLEEIIFMLFFVISALYLDLSTLWLYPLIIIAYVLFRFIGKVGGTYLGGKVAKSDKEVTNYLGFTLLPQAGVAIGLALSLQDQAGFESLAPIIINVIIATTVIHEVVGPLLTRHVLTKYILPKQGVIMMNNKPTMIYGTAWKKEQTTALVSQALNTGFRAIDTACQPKHYEEPLVGEAIKAFLEAGHERSELYIQTKFTPLAGQDPNRLPYDPKAPLEEQIRTSFATSLQNLGTDYLDGYLLHSPIFPSSEMMKAWKVMEEFYNEGKIKALGISNCYELSTLMKLYEQAKIKPSIVQNRFYGDTDYDKGIRAWAYDHEVSYQSFWSLTANPHILESSPLVHLAMQHKVEPAQIFYRYLQQIGITPLNGTTSPEHMAADLAINNIELAEHEVRAISQLL